MPSANIVMLQTVANGLGNLKDDMVVSVKEYLKEECQKLLKNDGLSEGIGSALSFESGDDRPEIIEERISDIARI